MPNADILPEQPQWDFQTILDAIPHRRPFLFVDKIVDWTDERIITEYTYKNDEFFFPGHYPGSPLVPGVILCESAMQAGAVFLSRLFDQEDSKEDAEKSSGRKVPVVGRMNEIKFKRMVSPGETVRFEVSFKEKMGSAYFLTAKGTVDGVLAVRLDFACTRTVK